MTTLLQHASVAEIMQTCVALVGLVLSQREVWRNVVSLVDLTDTPFGDLRRLVALKNVSVEMLLSIAQGTLFVVGVASLLLPPPAEELRIAESTQAVVVRIGMMIVTGLMTLAVFVKVQLDSRFLHLIPPPNGDDPTIVVVDPTAKEGAKEGGDAS